MQKWNILTDRAQRVDGNSRVICSVMFTSRVMVIIMSKITFLCYLLMTTKISPDLAKIFKCTWKVLFIFFRKRYWLLGSKLPLERCQPLKIQDFDIFLLTQQFFYNSTLKISWTVSQRLINHTIFWKNSIRSSRFT